MTAERLQEIQQLLEACKDVDANDWDAEKTSIVAELLEEVATVTNYAATVQQPGS